MITKPILSWRYCLVVISAVFSPAGLRADDAVSVTIEADDTVLAVGQSTTVTVYGQLTAAADPHSLQIVSWYIDLLNDDGAAVSGYDNVQKPAADNHPDTSGEGEPNGANLLGIYDTFLDLAGAGKGSRVVLVQFDVTARAPGTSTFSVAAGSTSLPLRDFLGAPTSGESLTGGIYTEASVEITVSGEVDLTNLDLTVTVIGTQANLTFNPMAGYNHTVQFSDTLQPMSWADFPGEPHNLGTLLDDLAGNPERFYRVLLTPQ